MKNTKLTFDTDASDVLTAIENAISYIEEAQEEMRGLGELEDEFDILCDAVDELTRKREKYEIRVASEYQEMVDELTRDYYKEVL